MEQFIGFVLFTAGQVGMYLVGDHLEKYRLDLRRSQPFYRGDSEILGLDMMLPRNYTAEGRSRLPYLYGCVLLTLVGAVLWAVLGNR